MNDAKPGIFPSLSPEDESNMLSERFLSYVFHELRTPLTVVHSYAQIALDKLPDGTEFDGLRRIMNRMINQGEEMVEMIEELLEAARIPLGSLNLDRAEVELARLIAETVERLPDESQPDILFSPLDRAALILADAQRLERVFSTLFKFGLSEQKSREVNPQIEVTYQIEQSEGQVQVQMMVPGLDLTPEQQQDLFDLYRPVRSSARLEGKAGSLDIGLYVARGIVEAHLGRLDYNEKLPGFRIDLPLVKEPLV